MKRSQRLVFISVCHSVCLLAVSRLSVPLPVLTCLLSSASLYHCDFPSACFPPFFFFFAIFDLSLSHSAVPSLVPGRQLEAVEGSPVVPRLHGDENPTGGSPVQQEETIAGGPREEPKPPLEISGSTSSKTTTSIHQDKTRHSRLGDCLHAFCMYWCFDNIRIPIGQHACFSALHHNCLEPISEGNLLSVSSL